MDVWELKVRCISVSGRWMRLSPTPVGRLIIADVVIMRLTASLCRRWQRLGGFSQRLAARL